MRARPTRPARSPRPCRLIRDGNRFACTLCLSAPAISAVRLLLTRYLRGTSIAVSSAGTHGLPMHPIDPSSSMIMKSVGHYGRRVTAKAGGLSLKIPKPRGKASRSQLVERYRRREESVGEALMEMYPAGDVSGGSEHASRGRHQPTAAGRADALADAFRQAQENLRGNRRMMRAPPGGRIPVRVRGRRAAQAPVGRKRGERGRARRHRGRRRGAPRGDRGRTRA